MHTLPYLTTLLANHLNIYRTYCFPTAVFGWVLLLMFFCFLSLTIERTNPLLHRFTMTAALVLLRIRRNMLDPYIPLGFAFRTSTGSSLPNSPNIYMPLVPCSGFFPNFAVGWSMTRLLAFTLTGYERECSVWWSDVRSQLYRFVKKCFDLDSSPREWCIC